MFRVNELFTSVQGEGRQCGRPAVFLRFQGCPIRCAFCDSAATWEAAAVSPMSLAALQAAIRHEQAAFPRVSHMVLTGGEPLYHNPDLVDLCRWLLDGPFETIQIETSGAVAHPAFAAFLESEAADRVVLTISPKSFTADPGRYAAVDAAYLRRCAELKFLVGTEADLRERIPAFLNQAAPYLSAVRPPAISLQPMERHNDSGEALRLCLAAALDNNWFLSLQTHKMIGIR